MIYLATPYSDPDPAVRRRRFGEVNRAAAMLLFEGHVVYSPVSHGHPIELAAAEIGDHDFWLRQCLAFAAHCDELYVLKLPGWQESRGVRAEIEVFKAAGKPVTYMAVPF